MTWSALPNFYRTSLLLSFLLVSGLHTFAQEDSLKRTELVVPDTGKVHSPKKATVLSAILPGLGQAYNKKYWKIPIVYAGLAATTYFIHINNQEYHRYKTAYLYRIDGDPNTVDEFVNIYNDEAQLRSLTDFYRRNRDLMIIGTAGVYLLNIIDAAVDAHFYDFDVSDDLSLRIQPVVMPKKYSGLALTFKF